jgi:hypothetical protein
MAAPSAPAAKFARPPGRYFGPQRPRPPPSPRSVRGTPTSGQRPPGSASVARAWQSRQSYTHPESIATAWVFVGVTEASPLPFGRPDGPEIRPGPRFPAASTLVRPPHTG